MRRLWHWLTCRAQVCIYVYGIPQHPTTNRKRLA